MKSMQTMLLLLLLLIGFGAYSSPVNGEGLRLVFEIQPGNSSGLDSAGSGWWLFSISGSVYVEVESGEVRVLNRSLRTWPTGHETLLDAFVYHAAIDETIDTSGNGQPDTWLFSVDDDNCDDDGFVSQYQGVVSTEAHGGSGELELTGDHLTCYPDLGSVRFNLMATETQVTSPLPVPTTSEIGLILLTISVAGMGFLFVKHSQV